MPDESRALLAMIALIRSVAHRRAPWFLHAGPSDLYVRNGLRGLSFGTRGKASCGNSLFHPSVHPSIAHSPIRAHMLGERARCPRHPDPAGNTQLISAQVGRVIQWR